MAKEDEPFLGLTSIVDVWRSMDPVERNVVRERATRLSTVLDRSDEYLKTIENHPAINEDNGASSNG